MKSNLYSSTSPADLAIQILRQLYRARRCPAESMPPPASDLALLRPLLESCDVSRDDITQVEMLAWTTMMPGDNAALVYAKVVRQLEVAREGQLLRLSMRPGDLLHLGLDATGGAAGPALRITARPGELWIEIPVYEGARWASNESEQAGHAMITVMLPTEERP